MSKFKVDQNVRMKLKKVQHQNWRSKFIVKQNGSLKANAITNVVLILKYDPYFAGAFRFNEFSEEVDIVRDIKIESDNGVIEIAKGKISDYVLIAIARYIESQAAYGQTSFNDDIISKAIISVARENKYHPLRDYIDNAWRRWDGQERLADFFPTYLGVERSPAQLLITKLFFLSGVSVVYHPEKKVDWVFDLIGSQGVGKTTLVQKLAPLGLYTDQFYDFHSRDSFQVLQGAFIVNDDEMTATKNSTPEQLKKFSTDRKFEYRKPYGRNPTIVQKKLILVRTSNKLHYLKDRTGDRRMLPLKANKELQQKHPVIDLDEEEVMQLWGEAVALYKQLENPLRLTKEQEELLDEHRKPFRRTTDLEDLLYETLENHFKDKKFISNGELSWKLFADERKLSINSNLSKKIRYYMENLGYDIGAFKYIKGKNCRGFAKK